VALATRTVAPIIAAAWRANHASDANVCRDLARLPGLLDRVDELLEEGTIGGAEPNAADYQIGTSTALLATMDDLWPLLDRRPALEHARRVAPGYPGRLPRVFPAAWLPD
jgi:glutathione S-transferase